jgi:hypothetical protein
MVWHRPRVHRVIGVTRQGAKNRRPLSLPQFAPVLGAHAPSIPVCRLSGARGTWRRSAPHTRGRTLPPDRPRVTGSRSPVLATASHPHLCRVIRDAHRVHTECRCRRCIASNASGGAFPHRLRRQPCGECRVWPAFAAAEGDRP